MSQGYRYSLRRAAYVVLAMSSLLAPRFGLLRAQTATVTQDGPVMDGVQDVLNGRRTILQIDDLAATMSASDGSGNAYVALYYARTEDSHFVPGDSKNPNPTKTIPLRYVSNTPFHPAFFSVQSGWMFNLPAQVLGIFSAASPCCQAGWYLAIDSDAANIPTLIQDQGYTLSSTTNEMLMGDFAGTGYDQALLVNWESTGTAEVAYARVAGAVDPNNPSAGLKSGARVGLPNNDQTQPLPTIATGDFYGDGKKEIAILANDGTTLQFYSVGSDYSLHLLTTIQVAAAHEGFIPSAMAAGHFRTTNRDELAIAGQRFAQGQLEVKSIGITLTPQQSGPPTFTASLAATYDYPVDQGANILKVLAQAGPLQNWASNQDQLVIVKDEDDGYGGNIIIGQFDSSFNYSQLSTTNGTDDHKGCIYSLALGNFDNVNFPNLSHNPSLQIATYWVSEIDDCSVNKGNAQPQIRIWTPDPTNPGDWLHYGVTDHIETPNEGYPAPSNTLFGAAMTVADTQGRSLRLGPPEKVTIQGQIQPDVVLGVPPMQIDEIIPNSAPDKNAYPNCQTPNQFCTLNVSAIPKSFTGAPAFSTAFNFASSSSTSNEEKSTTSWGIAVKTSVSEKTTFGVAGAASISEKVTASAGFTHDNLVANTYNTYKTYSQNVNYSTGWADFLFYSARRHNIYYYPVLGNNVCPGSAPGCGDEQKTPLYIAFSVPDTAQRSKGDATELDWYQPIQEPGNIFSYPGTLQQVKDGFHSTDPLNEVTQTSLSTGSGSVQFGWSGAQNQSRSVGTTNSFSQGLGISVSGKASSGIATAEGSVSVDVNASQSLGSLNLSTQALSASEGITVLQPSFSSYASDTLGYSYYTYILGTQPFADTFQTLKPTGPNNQPLDVASSGPMYVAFTANMPMPWYQTQYKLPDVGLNHPGRWSLNTNGSLTFSAFDKNAPPVGQEFYHMKGFFITPEADEGITGPTMTVATAGDKLKLTARIYNFSPVATDSTLLTHPASKVWVRFYAQELDTSQESLVGLPQRLPDAFLSSIPGYAPQSGTPNWDYASTTFDTTGWDGKHVIFWVYVWLVDANDNMVKEMVGHGLSSDPKDLPINQITDVPVDTYSNNVGMYSWNDPLHIAPAAVSVGAAPEPETGPVTVSGISFAANKILLNTRNRVTVDLATGDTASSSVYLTYYDGSPKDSNNVFAFQNIAHIDANSNYSTGRSLTPSTCGEHTIYAVASTTGSNVSSTKSARVRVTVDPVSSVQDIQQSLAGADLRKELKRRLSLLLDVSETLFQKGKTHEGLRALRFFTRTVRENEEREIPAGLASSLISQAQQILGCVTAPRRDDDDRDASLSEEALKSLIEESEVHQRE